MLINVNLTITSFFTAIIKTFQNCERLDRLIIDKAYLILIVTYYRENLELLKILRRIKYFIIYLIAILLSIEKRELKQSLHFTQIKILRVNNNRINL